MRVHFTSYMENVLCDTFPLKAEGTRLLTVSIHGGAFFASASGSVAGNMKVSFSVIALSLSVRSWKCPSLQRFHTSDRDRRLQVNDLRISLRAEICLAGMDLQLLMLPIS